MMKILIFFVSTIIELYTILLLLRAWMQWTHCDFHDPFSQLVVRITQPIVKPFRRFIPNTGPIDSTALLIAYILCIIKVIVLFMVVTFSLAIFIAAVLILLRTVGLLIFWVLLGMSITNWINRGYNSIDYVLTQLTEPLLRPIRNALPSMISNIDFSPMIFMIFLYILDMGIIELLQFTDDIFLSR